MGGRARRQFVGRDHDLEERRERAQFGLDATGDERDLAQRLS